MYYVKLISIKQCKIYVNSSANLHCKMFKQCGSSLLVVRVFSKVKIQTLIEFSSTKNFDFFFFNYGIALNILNIIFRLMPTLTNFEK